MKMVAVEQEQGSASAKPNEAPSEDEGSGNERFDLEYEFEEFESEMALKAGIRQDTDSFSPSSPRLSPPERAGECVETEQETSPTDTADTTRKRKRLKVKVGDKINAQDYEGTWYPATVLNTKWVFPLSSMVYFHWPTQSFAPFSLVVRVEDSMATSRDPYLRSVRF
jgi:hypothetical protein